MSETMNEIAETINPNSETQAMYNRLYPIFEATYHALLPIYDMMVGIEG
jgi:hypothetical protein